MSQNLADALAAYTATVPVQRATEEATTAPAADYSVNVPSARTHDGLTHTAAVVIAEQWSRNYGHATISRNGVVVAYYVRGLLGTWRG
jgi:hypothetical protein